VIAASFDPSGRTSDAILARALSPEDAGIAGAAGFRLAYAPPAQFGSAGPLACLLEGELFNRDELCAALGVSPETQPPKLVALAFEAWDLGAFVRLRGTFSVALWDADRRRAVLTTDHLGVGSWYLRRADGHVLAATTMAALLRMLPAAPETDPIKAITWLSGRSAPESLTFARGLERLAGAHAIVVHDDAISSRRWWQPVYREPFQASRTELAQQMRAILGNTLRSRLPPAETTAVMLSGGFDSAAVAGVAASERGEPERLRTYSAVFPDDADMDESPRVRALVLERGLASRLVAVKPAGIARLALEYQRAWGIPVAGPGYLLERPLLECAETDGACGVLDGQGGDELFGFSPYLIADRVRGGHLIGALRLLSSLPDHAGFPPRSVLRHWIQEYAVRPLLPSRLEQHLRLRGDAARHMPTWLRRDRLDLFLQSENRLAWREAHDGPLWWRSLAELLTSGREMLAEYIAHRGQDLRLQMRPPLFDVDLIEFALQIPPQFGYGGINRSIARESVAGDMPAAVRLAAKKSDLGPFYHATLCGHDLASIRSLLEPRDARIYEYVNRARTIELLERPVRVGSPGWRECSQAIWVSLTGEIALRSLEDAGFCQAFLEAHNPPVKAFVDVA
jgi:asparagine synthase (glutamine-hydrolysing)